VESCIAKLGITVFKSTAIEIATPVFASLLNSLQMIRSIVTVPEIAGRHLLGGRFFDFRSDLTLCVE